MGFKLKKENKELTIHCYVDPDVYRLRTEKAVQVARLTLYSNITERIEVKERKRTRCGTASDPVEAAG